MQIVDSAGDEKVRNEVFLRERSTSDVCHHSIEENASSPPSALSMCDSNNSCAMRYPPQGEATSP
jgi:hypothetical protein